MDRSRSLSYLPRYHSPSPSRHRFPQVLRSSSQPRILYVDGEPSGKVINSYTTSSSRPRTQHVLTTKAIHHRKCRSEHDLLAAHLYTSREDLTNTTSTPQDVRATANSCEDLYHKGPYFPDVSTSESGVSVGGSETDSVDEDDLISHHNCSSSSAFFEATADSDLESCPVGGVRRRVRDLSSPDSSRSSPFDSKRRDLISSPSWELEKLQSRFHALRISIPGNEPQSKSIKEPKKAGDKSVLSSTPLAQSTPHVSPRGFGEVKLSIKATWNVDDPETEVNFADNRSHVLSHPTAGQHLDISDHGYKLSQNSDIPHSEYKLPSQLTDVSDSECKPQFHATDSSCNSSFSEDNFSDVSSLSSINSAPRRTRLVKKSSDPPLSARRATSLSSISSSPINKSHSPDGSIDGEASENSGEKSFENDWWAVYNIESANARKAERENKAEREKEAKKASKVVKPMKVAMPLINAGKHGKDRLKRLSLGSPPPRSDKSTANSSPNSLSPTELNDIDKGISNRQYGANCNNFNDSDVTSAFSTKFNEITLEFKESQLKYLAYLENESTDREDSDEITDEISSLAMNQGRWETSYSQSEADRASVETSQGTQQHKYADEVSQRGLSTFPLQPDSCLKGSKQVCSSNDHRSGNDEFGQDQLAGSAAGSRNASRDNQVNDPSHGLSVKGHGETGSVDHPLHWHLPTFHLRHTAEGGEGEAGATGLPGEQVASPERETDAHLTLRTSVRRSVVGCRVNSEGLDIDTKDKTLDDLQLDLSHSKLEQDNVKPNVSVSGDCESVVSSVYQPFYIREAKLQNEQRQKRQLFNQLLSFARSGGDTAVRDGDMAEITAMAGGEMRRGVDVPPLTRGEGTRHVPSVNNATDAPAGQPTSGGDFNLDHSEQNTSPREQITNQRTKHIYRKTIEKIVTTDRVLTQPRSLDGMRSPVLTKTTTSETTVREDNDFYSNSLHNDSGLGDSCVSDGDITAKHHVTLISPDTASRVTGQERRADAATRSVAPLEMSASFPSRRHSHEVLDSIQAELSRLSADLSTLSSGDDVTMVNDRGSSKVCRNSGLRPTSKVYEDHGEATSVLKATVRGDVEQDLVNQIARQPASVVIERYRPPSFPLNLDEEIFVQHESSDAEKKRSSPELYDNDYDNVTDNKIITSPTNRTPHRQNQIQRLKPGHQKASSLWTLQEETDSLVDASSPKSSLQRNVGTVLSQDLGDIAEKPMDESKFTTLTNFWASQDQTNTSSQRYSLQMNKNILGQSLSTQSSLDDGKYTKLPRGSTSANDTSRQFHYDSSDFDQSDGCYSSVSTPDSGSCWSSREQTPLSEAHDEAMDTHESEGLLEHLPQSSTRLGFNDFANGVLSTNSTSDRLTTRDPFSFPTREVQFSSRYSHTKAEATKDPFSFPRRDGASLASSMCGVKRDPFSFPKKENSRDISPQSKCKTSVSFSLVRPTISADQNTSILDKLTNSLSQFASPDFWASKGDNVVKDTTTPITCLHSFSSKQASGVVPLRPENCDITPYTCFGTAQVVKKNSWITHDLNTNSTSTPKGILKSALRKPTEGKNELKRKLEEENVQRFDRLLTDFDNSCKPHVVKDVVFSDEVASNGHTGNTSSNSTDMYKDFTTEETEKKQNHVCIVVEDENMSTFRFKRFLKKSHTKRTRRGTKILRFLSRLGCVSESSPNSSPRHEPISDDLFLPDASPAVKHRKLHKPVPISSSSFHHFQEFSPSSSPQPSPTATTPSSSNQSLDSLRSRTDSAYSSVSESGLANSVSSPLSCVSSPSHHLRHQSNTSRLDSACDSAFGSVSSPMSFASTPLSGHQHAAPKNVFFQVPTPTSGSPAVHHPMTAIDRSHASSLSDSAYSTNSDMTNSRSFSEVDFSSSDSTQKSARVPNAEELTALSDFLKEFDVSEGKIDTAKINRLRYCHREVQ